MPRVYLRSRLPVLGLLGLSMCAAGCSGGPAPGSGSPEEAVTALLAPFAKPFRGDPRDEQRRAKQAQAIWRSLCEHVDPDIRRGLHLDENSKSDPLVSCGAVVSLMIAETGDTGPISDPETIKATPISAVTRGNTSVVQVALRYTVGRGASYPAPASPVTVKVLTVRRGSGWFVATPDAVNPRHARTGGLTEAQLRADHTKLLTAAR
jgi:hypothetical protein